MAGTESPGALAGAAGAGMLIHASAESTLKIARKARPRKAGALYRIKPITEPAPVWSACVHSFRGLAGEAENIRAPHGGECAGRHGRNIPRREAMPDWKGGAA